MYRPGASSRNTTAASDCSKTSTRTLSDENSNKGRLQNFYEQGRGEVAATHAADLTTCAELELLSFHIGQRPVFAFSVQAGASVSKSCTY